MKQRQTTTSTTVSHPLTGVLAVQQAVARAQSLEAATAQNISIRRQEQARDGAATARRAVQSARDKAAKAKAAAVIAEEAAKTAELKAARAASSSAMLPSTSVVSSKWTRSLRMTHGLLYSLRGFRACRATPIVCTRSTV